MDVAVILLAAGEGKRMKSTYPKVLHRLCGKPMVNYIADAVRKVRPKRFLVVTSQEGAKAVGSELDRGVEVVVQDRPLGTGHAIQATKGVLKGFSGTILVVCGDTPLLTSETLKDLTKVHVRSEAVATVLTAKLSRPRGYGRIIRGDGGIKKIIEERDATPDERFIREVNTGTYCFDSKKLFRALQKIKPDNDQQEYYLTDVIEVLNSAGEKVVAKQAEDETEVMGVNSRVELADAEMILRARINEFFMEKGVTLVHPPLTYIDADVRIGRDTIIYPLSFLFGKTVVGEGCHIGPSCQITDSVVGDGVTMSFTVLERVRIEKGARIGPFSHLRPETTVGEGGKVGSFVEIKKTDIGKGSKVPHLSYVGDATIGKDVNVGAGTITCNFDGVAKNRTVIEDKAFIGSDSILIAPVKIGKGAYTGAGSIISEDVPADALAIERTEQRNIKGWAKRKLKLKTKNSKPKSRTKNKRRGGLFG